MKNTRTHFSHERTIIDAAFSCVIVYFDYSLPSSDFSTAGKSSRGRQTRRSGAKGKGSTIGSVFADVKTHSRPWVPGSSSRSCIAKVFANDTQLQLESQRCYVTRRGVICPARRVENRRDRRCLAVGIVLILCYVVIIAKAAF